MKILYKVQIKEFNNNWINASGKYSNKQKALSAKYFIMNNHKIKESDIRILDIIGGGE